MARAGQILPILKLLDLCDEGFADAAGGDSRVRGTTRKISAVYREVHVQHEDGTPTLVTLRDVANDFNLPWPETRAAWVWLSRVLARVNDNPDP